jgi:putative peptidoglycan binding protein
MNLIKLTLLSGLALLTAAVPAAYAQRGGRGGGGHGAMSASHSFSAGRPSFGMSSARAGNWHNGAATIGSRGAIGTSRGAVGTSRGAIGTSRWHGGNGSNWHHGSNGGNWSHHHGGHHHRGRIYASFFPYDYWGWGYYPYYGAAYYNGYYGDESDSGGSLVADVQQQLAQAGYYHGAVDGVFGNGTRSALRAYQRANGLRADGQIGNQTLSAMGLD